MKNNLTNTIEKKVFCLIMDLPESNSNKKTKSKMKNNLIDDHYSFQKTNFITNKKMLSFVDFDDRG